MRGDRSQGGGEKGLKGDKVFFRSSASGFMFHYTVLNLFYSPFSIQNPFSRNINATNRTRVLCWRGREMEKKNKTNKN